MKFPEDLRPGKFSAGVLASLVATAIWLVFELPFGDSSDKTGTTSPTVVSETSTTPDPTPTVTDETVDESDDSSGATDTVDSSDAEDSASHGNDDATNVSLDITEARIEVSSNGKVGPNSWEVGSQPGYEPVVITESKRLDRGDGCYVQWSVVNNGVTLDSDSTACAARGGFSEAYWPHVDYQRGTVKVTAKISTDWGESAVASVEFMIV